MNHAQQVTEINSPFLTRSLTEVDDHKAFVRRGDVAADERVGRVHRGDPLEIDIGFAELWTDVIDVIRHASQDRVHNRFGRITALCIVAMDLLNPPGW